MIFNCRSEYSSQIGNYDIEIINKTNGNVMVIGTELEDNLGMSITNNCEYLINQVCKQFNIDPLKLIWIEKYEYKPDEYDHITFEYSESNEKKFFTNPKWKSIEDFDKNIFNELSCKK